MRISDWSSDVCSSDLSVRSRQSPSPAVAGPGCQPGQASAEQSPDATPQIYLYVSLNDFKVNHSRARQSTAILVASDLAAFASRSARDRQSTRLNSSH